MNKLAKESYGQNLSSTFLTAAIFSLHAPAVVSVLMDNNRRNASLIHHVRNVPNDNA